MNNENIKEILNKLGAEGVPADVYKIAEQTSADFSKTLSQSGQLILWEHIVKSRIIKLAAVAVIVIAVLAGLPFFSGNGSGVALADVLERIEQAQAFMYRMKMTTAGAMVSGMPAKRIEMESTVTISNDYGMKMEMTMTDPNTGQEEMTQQMYILPDKKIMISLMPEQKKYMRLEFDDDLLTRMKRQNNDPREMIKQIMGCEYDELGRSVIDGIEVEGFRTTDPAFYGGAMENVELTLWVDVEKWLPVRTEMDCKMNEQMQMHGVIYDYQWDIPIDVGEFEPVIPENFKPLTTDSIKMPSMSEEGAVEGLKFFAELTGKYPNKLNMMSLMQDFGKLKESRNAAAEQFRQKLKQTKSEEEKMTAMMEMMRPIQSISMFYMTLVQDKKEPVYYGQSVGPNDADAVLMRWKVSDDEYRAIFGDLTIKNVSAEELAELEELSPK